MKRTTLLAILFFLSSLSFSGNIYAQSAVTTYSMNSSVLNRTMQYNVYFPSSYDASPNTYYPVMYLFHGYFGTYSDWADNGMQDIVDDVIDEGYAEMIIVMPDGLDAFYINGYVSGINWETYFHDELIPTVESKFRIDPKDGQHRAIAGLSMGGYGASYHGFKYPDKFSSAYSMSGAFGVTDISVESVINPSNYPVFTMECGTDDGLVYDLNVNFHNTLDSMGIQHSYIVRSGSHDWTFWMECLPKAVRQASDSFDIGNGIDADGDGYTSDRSI